MGTDWVHLFEVENVPTLNARIASGTGLLAAWREKHSGTTHGRKRRVETGRNAKNCAGSAPPCPPCPPCPPDGANANTEWGGERRLVLG